MTSRQFGGWKQVPNRRVTWTEMECAASRETNRRANLSQSKKRIIIDISALYVT